LAVAATPGGLAVLPISGNATLPPQPSLSPTTRTFSSTRIGQASTATTFELRMIGPITGETQPLVVVCEGTDAASFQITYDDCQGQILYQARPSCRIDVRFAPKAPAGQKSADLGVRAGPEQVVRATLYGQALCANGQSTGC
jgi:hypothetical protein